MASVSHVRARSHFVSTAGERAGVALEEREVGAVAADGDLDRERAAPAERLERLPDERRLAVPPRRDEEHLLPVAEVGDQPVELDFAVDERLAGHDFAVDEGVVHCVTLTDVMITLINVTRLGGSRP